jgi:transcriptional regulator with XRE-family HTH domain
MSTDFSRTLSLLRQEKGLSQRKAAAALGISQALLSHYENGIREPGLGFVVKACDFYRVSADYLLGRTLSRDGAIIGADDLYDSTAEKGSLKGSILATLQKKLVVNTANVLFDLLGKTGSRSAITAAGDYLSGALYQLLRQLYRRSGASEDFFALGSAAFDAGLVDADMNDARIRYLRALAACDESAMPPVSGQTLTTDYPGLGQSAAQVFHNTDERTVKHLSGLQ